MILIRLIIIATMIFFTALFVASEFALVKIRTSQLERLKDEGNKKANLALHVTHHLDEYLSACQLGITLTSLAIGWLGESTIESLLHPFLSYLPIPASVLSLISLVLAFLVVTFVHVVIGELVPKSYSISKTETVVLAVVHPLHLFYKITYPFIWLLNHAANATGKLFGIQMVAEGDETHTEEELLYIATNSYRKGEINRDEYVYLNNIFEFDERMAKEVMTNRTEMEVLEADTLIEPALHFAINKTHSRYPVIGESKDEIMGYVTLQQLVKSSFAKVKVPLTVADIAKEPIIMIETIPIKQLLKEMQKSHKHLAILIDEYGGTSGLVTIENILEEIVGDIQDEADKEPIKMKKIAQDSYLVDGRVEIEDIEKLFDTVLKETNGIISIGGYISNLYHTEICEGFSVTLHHLRFTVTDYENHVIQQLRIEKLPEETEDTEKSRESK
ncbi:hemolysin family protein [Vagococcus entomophilus]|uniref:hemolysin family protein n=1 Tax=Vagococcus entomophilus TaxID=1160095 RepID=UPI000F889B56|nr:hemolysin family protein [Vagococcus entomophilus]